MDMVLWDGVLQGRALGQNMVIGRYEVQLLSETSFFFALRM